MVEKEDDLVTLYKELPRRKVPDADKQLIMLLLERSKIQREESLSTLNHGFLLFVTFIGIALVSEMKQVVPQSLINTLFILGILVICFATISYRRTIQREHRTLNSLFKTIFK